ncbi:MAG: 2-oxoacid:acceptor oxidoreductase family protein, partial [Bacteroidaceae bacterium]|nr:2-oxoacid:acceptor oxidoreductase family protein [Bacteroidaceae bacterium]
FKEMEDLRMSDSIDIGSSEIWLKLNPVKAAQYLDAIRIKYKVAIILNQPSLERFEETIKPGGILIYDGYGICTPPKRKDINVYRIDAMDTAATMNNVKSFNMIVLGGLLKVVPIVNTENILQALRETLPTRHHHLIPMNEEALRKGMEIVTPLHTL